MAGDCCPVQARDKIPLVKEWQKVATSNLDQLEAWATQFPGCNWGLATGPGSGVVAVDVDGVKGRASLGDLERQGLTLPPTLTVATGHADGGEHRYYRMPPGVLIRNDQSGKIAPHIDVRGEGGYVVTPPSTHETGAQYRFMEPNAELASLPTWIAARLSVRVSVPTTTASEPQQMSPKIIGQGHRTPLLFKLAGKLHSEGVSMNGIDLQQCSD